MILILGSNDLALTRADINVSDVSLEDFRAFYKLPIEVADIVIFRSMHDDGTVNVKLLKNRQGWLGNYKFTNRKEFRESAIFAFISKEVIKGDSK